MYIRAAGDNILLLWQREDYLAMADDTASASKFISAFNLDPKFT